MVETISDILIAGIPLGCLYALVAVSYNILYRPTNVFNFAQGDFVMLAALLVASFLSHPNVTWVVAVLGAMLFIGAISMFEEAVAVAPIMKRASESSGWIITTLA